MAYAKERLTAIGCKFYSFIEIPQWSYTGSPGIDVLLRKDSDEDQHLFLTGLSTYSKKIEYESFRRTSVRWLQPIWGGQGNVPIAVEMAIGLTPVINSCLDKIADQFKVEPTFLSTNIPSVLSSVATF
jgi:hypothetical protein